MKLSQKFATELFAGGGEMGALMRAHDWSRTALGPVEEWPKSLRIAARILLGSGYPMYIAWGPQFIQLYNDAYRPILGTVKHPSALGNSTPVTFPELWDLIGPMFRRVMTDSMATTVTDQLLLLDRNGYTEEAYFTFSYSAIPSDDEEMPGGVLVTCLETTDRLLEGRRLRTLRDLASETSGLTTEREVCEVAARTLEKNLHDLPFTLLYLRDATGLRLESSSGMDAQHPAAGAILEEEFWPVFDASAGRAPLLVRDVDKRFGTLPSGAWSVSLRDAALCPLLASGEEEPIGFLIVGLNPYRQFDGPYSTFLQRVAAQISTSINDVRAYEAERKRAEALAELDRAKTTFFSNISHEFRTPLTLMIGPMEEILASREPLPPDITPRLEIAHRNALRLLKLVNNLLDFSRLEAGRIRAIYEPVDLSRFTAELASGFRAAIERAGLRFIIDCEPLRDTVFVDREMWEKIVLNLLSNAFKFTFEGQIAVSQRQVGDSLELTVSDSGTGIAESEVPNLFKRFHRIEGARGRSYEGSGIGLALVHELVKLHGGNIRIETELGRGSKFLITVPTGSAHLPAEHLGGTRESVSTATRIETFVNESLRWTAGEETSIAAADSSLAPVSRIASNATTLEGSRILIVDDNADMREYLARLLSHSFRVEAAGDGVEALESIRRQLPDLVISDVMMPRMNGLELLKALRGDPSLQALPIILLSARADEEARIEGLEAGADDYLTKPFTARELMARIAARLEIAKLRAESEERAHREASKVQSILESTTDAVFMLDREWRFIYLNKNAEEQIAGGRVLLGRNLWEEFPDAVSRDFYKQYHRAMQDRVHVEFEEHYPAPLDKWFTVHAYPTDDGIAVFFRDATERRKAEAALRQSEKLAAVGRLAASIAHEINNPLESVTNLLYILGSSPALQERDRSFLKTAQSELARVSHIAARTLRFYRQSSNPSETSLQEVLDSVIDLFERRLQDGGISVERHYKRAEPLMGYVGELRQVFANLLANSMDATPRGGKICVSVRNSRRWSDGVRGVRVTIADTGHGMVPEVQKRIFEPFFTTKDATGTGLGLWVSREIIDKHKGSTHVRSSYGAERHGTTFSIFLPCNVHVAKAES